MMTVRISRISKLRRSELTTRLRYLRSVMLFPRVETVAVKYGQMKATMSYKMAGNSVQVENISRQVSVFSCCRR